MMGLPWRRMLAREGSGRAKTAGNRNLKAGPWVLVGRRCFLRSGATRRCLCLWLELDARGGKEETRHVPALLVSANTRQCSDPSRAQQLPSPVASCEYN